ncbi:MAG: gamma-glutamyl-gamma-aminobutyrate hydrolase family protein, partial [Planctomycetota bacterium]
MRKPRIGITMSLGTDRKPTSARLRAEYVDAVVAAGGVPVALPHVESKGLLAAQLEAVGGLLLIGGPDYDPARYGERPPPGAVLVNPRRERYEIALVRAADGLRMPILGICGGHQLVNIVRGGTIVQDLASSGLYPGLVRHRAALGSESEAARRGRAAPGSHGKSKSIRHPVSVEAGSRLAKVMGAR